MPLRRSQHCHDTFTQHLSRIDNKLIALTIASMLIAGGLVLYSGQLSIMTWGNDKETLGALWLSLTMAALAPLTPVHLIVNGIALTLSAPKAFTSERQREAFIASIEKRINHTFVYAVLVGLASLVAIFSISPTFSAMSYMLAVAAVLMSTSNGFILTQRWLRPQ